MLVALQFWWNGSGAAPPPTATAGIISGKIPRSDGSRRALQRIFDRADPNKFVAREARILKSLSQLDYKSIRATGGNRLLDLEDFARKRAEEREKDDEEAIINLLSHL